MVAAARTLLLVEDDADIREIVALEVGTKGYEVLVATDAREAIAVLSTRKRIDVVLTDLTMPGLDGFALIRAMRAHETWRKIPTLVFTAACVTDKDRAELQGAAILRKPIRLDLLLAAIDAAMPKT